MYIQRFIHPTATIRLTWQTTTVNGLWAVAVVFLHEIVGVKLLTPFLTVSTLGIAVAFLDGPGSAQCGHFDLY